MNKKENKSKDIEKLEYELWLAYLGMGAFGTLLMFVLLVIAIF